MKRQQGVGFLSSAVLAFALTRCAIVACTPVVQPGASQPTVQAVCLHLVNIQCGHDLAKCVAGLGEEVDAGRQSVDLACAFDAGNVEAAAGCAGIGICPP